MAEPLQVKVLFFAAARERVGLSQCEFELSQGATVQALLTALEGRYPALGPLLPHLRVAVNQVFCGTDALLPQNAEVALIPPVAGGSGAFRVQAAPLSLETVRGLVEAPNLGGTVTFVGKVRNQTRGQAVLRLEYEAYAPMAERVLAKIAAEVSEKWPGTHVAIHHRVGVLEPGEAAVIIAVAAPHRKEAFAGCEHALERLKQDVPIWKKEVYTDGAIWVGLGP